MIDKLWLKAGVYVIMNVAFIAYDLFITVLVRFYFERLRHRFRKKMNFVWLLTWNVAEAVIYARFRQGHFHHR